MTQETAGYALGPHEPDDAATSVHQIGPLRDIAAHATGGAEARMAAGRNSFRSLHGDSWAIRTAEGKPATPAEVGAHQSITFPRAHSETHVLRLSGAAL
ncbi:hypothetical protein [Cellulomonas sp. URHB0016]